MGQPDPPAGAERSSAFRLPIRFTALVTPVSRRHFAPGQLPSRLRHGGSPFFPNSFENSRNLGEKARGLLDLWVTFCFHFLTGGKAGNQIEQFDLDS